MTTKQNREQKAFAVLAAGGYFREMIERNFRGHLKNTYRLCNASGRVVSGFGYHTQAAFEARRLIERDWTTQAGSCWEKRYFLAA